MGADSLSIKKHIDAQYWREKSDSLGVPLLENQQKRGKFDNWLVLFLIAGILEGVFFDVVTPYVTNRSLFIFHLTPFNLYPTDFFFLPLGVFLMLFVRTKNNSGLQRGALLMWWWTVCIMATFVGVLNQTYYLSADIRNYILRAVLAFSVYRLALEANLRLVFDKIINISTVIAIFLIAIRLNVLMGVSALSIQTSAWGTHTLLLPYCILIMRVLMKERSLREVFPQLFIISLGILQAFWKPAVFGLAVAPLLTIFIPAYFKQSKVSGFKKFMRIFPILVLIILVGGLFLSTNIDYYYSIFRYSYLKEGFSIQDYSGNRFGIWAQVIEMWREKPFLGSGFGSALRGYLFLSSTGTYIYLDQIYIHNIALQFLYQFGVVGFFVVIILLFRWVMLMRQSMQIIPARIAGSYAGIVLFCILTVVISLVGEALRYSPAGFLFWASLGFEAAFAAHVTQTQTPAPSTQPYE